MELKVMILDDEYIILDGLCSFPWDTYGCLVVGKAGDGQKGLELVEKYQPDIILSDIKMPGMDGLEFARQVKSLRPETEIILLTGYDNFSFAQQALRIGVCEYLLKPVNFREMHSIIEKVCIKIREQNKKQQDYSEMRKRYKQTLPMVRSKLLSDLIYGHLKDRKDMAIRMNLLNLKIEKYVFIYARLQNPETGHILGLEPGLVDFIVCNICEEFMKVHCNQVFSERDTLGYCFVTVFPKIVEDADCINHCMQACELIQQNIINVIQTEISFGISQVKTDPYNMNAAYHQAVEACEQSVYIGDASSILEYNDVTDFTLNSWNITDGEKKRLFSEVARGNIETAKKFVAQAFEDCTDIEVEKYAAMELLISCFQYLGRETSNFRSGEGKNSILTDGIERIYSCHTRHDVLDYLKKTLGLIADKNGREQINRNQRTARNILKFIETHYKEDLSLDSLSEHFRISKTYINRLLKNYSGKSFLEILLDTRMAKAEQLISENKYKIYEVAEMVGYHDLSYFIRAFKKKFDVTPNVYRRI